jgi:site-specific DNA-methyltransferase (adenine-specific)
LIVGDCTDPATVARLMQGERADAVVTDPPYSSGGFTRGDRTASVDKKDSGKNTEDRPLFSGDNRDQRSWVSWFERWVALWAAECRNSAAMAFWTDWRQLPATTDAVQGGGVVWRGIAVWDKTTSARPMYNRFRAQAEYLVWGSLGDMPFNKGGDALPGVFMQSVDNAKEHITQKPVNVVEWTLSIVEQSGLVADPFLGSGTTLIAAHRTGRRCYGAEIECRYADVILRRAEAEGLTVERAP